MGPLMVSGRGAIGAKAAGLELARDVLAAGVAARAAPAFAVSIPPLAVITTDAFERFLADEELAGVVASPPDDDRLAAAFQRAALPADLHAFLAEVPVGMGSPLAVRSSSLLEDDGAEPLAGVYATCMVAGRARDRRGRVRELAAAVKQVYASTFAARARAARAAAAGPERQERMAVIVQEVAGRAYGERFYPQVAGVARTWNFYPAGLARPEDGAIALTLGLGRSLVEEGAAWPCSPAHPHANPPHVTAAELLAQTQKSFWAVDLSSYCGIGAAGTFRDGWRRCTLADAEEDGALAMVASTYLPDDDRFVPGLGRPGPRVVDFAPILKSARVPLVALLVDVLDGCRRALGAPVEIEFAVCFGSPEPLPARFALLQARPLRITYPEVEVQVADLPRADVLAASTRVLGNGVITTVRDVVYVRPSAFELRRGAEAARAIAEIDRRLLAAGRPYLLIGPGRWGTTDPSAGIAVGFSEIAGARAIVEATLPRINVLLSQGSHFFLNLASRRVLYFCVGHEEPYAVDWPWLEARTAVSETEFVRHVRLRAPLEIRADGRTGRGAIIKPR